MDGGGKRMRTKGGGEARGEEKLADSEGKPPAQHFFRPAASTTMIAGRVVPVCVCVLCVVDVVVLWCW
jgi:hypothetical protein